VHWVREAAAQAPPQVPLPAQVARVPWGGPEVTAAQSPRLVPRSQASQVPGQRLVQQTPSVQICDAHSASPPHAAPLGLAPHDPLTQLNPAAQGSVPEQVEAHPVNPGLQVKGAQLDGAGGATQVPAPSQCDS
jgi:hypothetical protein